MKAYQVKYTNNKGFLLLEVMVALFLLIGTVSGIALYQAHTQILCSDAHKRHQVLAVTNTVLEQLHTTGIIVPVTVIEGVTVVIKPALFDSPFTDYSGDDRNGCVFLTVQTTWTTTAGLPVSMEFITCMKLGRA